MEDPEPIYNVASILLKKIKVQGFIVTDDFEEYGAQGIETMSNLLKNGKLVYKEQVTEGIEGLPRAFVDMLQGKNFGKAVVHVADL